jgi:hypothetical protein
LGLFIVVVVVVIVAVVWWYWGFIQGFMLAVQILYHLSHAPTPFCFSYFPDRVSCFLMGLMLDYDPSTQLHGFPHSWDYRNTLPTMLFL